MPIQRVTSTPAFDVAAELRLRWAGVAAGDRSGKCRAARSGGATSLARARRAPALDGADCRRSLIMVDAGLRILGLVLLDGDRLPREPFDLSQLVALVAAAERRGDARRAGAARAADAVNVNLRPLRAARS